MINLGTINKTGTSEAGIKKSRRAESSSKVGETELTRAVKQREAQQKAGDEKENKQSSKKEALALEKSRKEEADSVYDERGKKSAGTQINISV